MTRIQTSLMIVVLCAAALALSTAAVAAEAEVFSFESGQYSMSWVIRVSGEADDKTETIEVTVTNEAGKITINNPDQPKNPIIGKIQGNDFTAHLDEDGGATDLTGKLEGNNRLAGKLVGKSKDGKQTLAGTFTLERKKAENAK